MKIHKLNFSVGSTLAALCCVICGCSPSGPDALLQGERLLNAGRPEAAVTKIEHAVDEMPYNAVAWNYLGLARHHAKQYDKAVAAYKRAAELDPTLNVVLYNRGCLEFDRRNYTQAVNAFTRYLGTTPNYIPAIERLGYSYWYSGNIVAAGTNLYTVFNQAPNAQVANTLGLILFEQGRYADACWYFRQGADLDRAYATPLLNGGIAAERLPGETNLVTALQFYREYVQRVPQSGSANVDAVRLRMEEIQKLIPTVAIAEKQEIKPVIDTTIPPGTNATETIAALPQQEVSVTPANVAQAQNTETHAVAAAQVPTQEDNDKHITISALDIAPLIIQTNTNVAPAVQAPEITVQETTVTKAPPPIEEVDIAAKQLQQSGEISENTTVAEALAQIAEKINDEENTPVVPDVSESVTPEEDILDETETTQPVTDIEIEAVKVKPYLTPIDDSEISPHLLPPSDVQDSDEPKTWMGRTFSGLFKKKDKKSKVEAVNKDKTKANNQLPKTVGDPEVPHIELEGQTSTVSEAESTPPYVYQPYEYKKLEKPASGDRNAANIAAAAAYQKQLSGDLDAAIIGYNEALKLDPSYADVHGRLALIYNKKKDQKKALEHFEQALAADPNAWKIRYNFAIILDQAGFYNETVLELKTVTQQNPTYAPAWLQLGKVYDERFGDKENAIASYSRFVELMPNDPSAGPVKSWLKKNVPSTPLQ